MDLEVKQKAVKEDIIRAILATDLQLGVLSKNQLKDMCDAEGLTVGGNKADLIRRLIL